jgi:5-methylcytosine-specific restriction endonuclease McrA
MHAFEAQTMKEYAKSFYKSKAWQTCREGYMSKVGGLCEKCLRSGRYVPAEIVHHKVHITPMNISNPEITLNFNNLEALCRFCHSEIHSETVKRFSVDELGRVVAR